MKPYRECSPAEQELLRAKFEIDSKQEPYEPDEKCEFELAYDLLQYVELFIHDHQQYRARVTTQGTKKAFVQLLQMQIDEEDATDAPPREPSEGKE